MKKGMIHVDIEKCLACKGCEIACAVEHSSSKELSEAIHETPSPRKRLTVECGVNFSLPMQCRQCEDAPCVRICPTKALKKTPEGIVVLEKELCIGCKWCIDVCPFGVIRMDDQSKVIIKCDLCIERLKKDELPACVMACPSRAIKFRSTDDTGKVKRRKFLVELTETAKNNG